jgi:hypothetical protein
MRMKPAIASEWAMIQLVEAKARAPSSPVSEENGLMAGYATKRMPEAAKARAVRTRALAVVAAVAALAASR